MANKYYKYTYTVELQMLFPDSTKLKIEVINKLTKHFNYPLNFFPEYECDCIVPLEYETKIRNNQDTLYVIMTITKNKYVNKPTYSEPEETEIILGGDDDKSNTFIPFFAPDSFNPMINDEAENKTDNAGNGTYNMGATSVCHLKFALYSVIGLKANKKILNYVADECDVGTMIKFLIDQTDIQSCIIDKPDNEDTYKNLIVTPHNINMAIRELQTRYGIYSNGLTNFYDPPCLYVLNKYSLTHDHEKDKENKILINCNVSTPGKGAGQVTIKENKKYNLEYDILGAPIPTNIDMAFSEMVGNEVIFSNISLTSNMIEYKDGKVNSFSEPTTAITSDVVNHKKTGNKSILDYDETNNPYNISSMLKSANLGTLVSLPEIPGIDIDSLRPNTLITLAIKDDEARSAEFNGIYSLISGSILIERHEATDSLMLASINNVVLSKMDSE